MGLFSDLFSTKPAEDAAKMKIAGINQGYTSATDAITTGLGTANGYYDRAVEPYGDLIDSTGRGSAAYGDATGANGADGYARARSMFEATPGYRSGMDMALDQNDRRAAARGILASGNTIADTTKLATSYADQNYGNYVARLSPYLAANQSAVGGQASVLGSQAGANLGAYGQIGDYGWKQGTGIGSANADAEMAKYDASKNFWGALMGGANLATKAFGGGGGGGNSGGSGGGGGSPFTQLLALFGG